MLNQWRAGLSHVGYPDCFQNSACKPGLTTLIFSSPFNTSTHFYDNLKELADTVIHELGHYFGLFHNFDFYGNQKASCYYEPQASTLRYMDYYNEPNIYFCAHDSFFNAAIITGTKTPYWEPVLDARFAPKVDLPFITLTAPMKPLCRNKRRTLC